MLRRAIPSVVAVLLGVAPAAAQFGTIFNDGPPRPPADVPSGEPSRMPPPPSSQPGRQPVPEPLATRPQTPRPPGAVQSQPLPPPPGAAAPPPANDALRGGQEPGQPQTLPGLPPGQRQPRPQQAPQQPADTSPQPGDEVVVAPPEQKITNPTAVFTGLDKITGRTITFDVAINETVQFGALQVTPRVCYSRPPTETPNTDAFVAVDEVTLQGEVRRIFSGWMFASSPGLHAVEHPIYDVWLVDCKGGAGAATAEVQPDKPAAAPVPKPVAKPQPPKRAPARPAPGPLFPPLR